MAKFFRKKKNSVSKKDQALNLVKYNFTKQLKLNPNEIRILIIINDKRFSEAYEVLVIYHGKNSPRSYLMKPKYKDIQLPHTYGYEIIEGDSRPSLCLFHPSEWDHNFLLSDTIVPWAIEWVYYYEMYLITGKWLGTEYPHMIGEKNG